MGFLHQYKFWSAQCPTTMLCASCNTQACHKRYICIHKIKTIQNFPRRPSEELKLLKLSNLYFRFITTSGVRRRKGAFVFERTRAGRDDYYLIGNTQLRADPPGVHTFHQSPLLIHFSQWDDLCSPKKGTCADILTWENMALQYQV